MPIKIVKSEKPPEKEVSVAEINNRGMTYLLRDMLAEAEAEFKKAIEKNPKYAIGHNNLGVIYLKQNKIAEAIKEFRLATKANLNYAEAFNNLGVAYYNKQKYTEAKGSFKKALKINQDYKEPQKNLTYLEEHFSNAITGTTYKKEEPPKNIISTQKVSKPVTLSLCMIVKNEEENLPRALSSVKDAVDEIIIVDTGSTDNTVEIAKSFGAKVYYYEWNGDFASARNEALNNTTCDWILSMDADDEMNVEQIKRLKEIMSSLEDDVVGIQLPIYSKTSDGNTMTNYLVRIFRNTPSIRFSRRIHEVVDFSITEMGGRVLRATDIPVIHRGYEDPNAIKNKLHRNFKLIKEEVERNPKDASIRMYLGKSYLSLGDVENSIKSYEEAIELAGNNTLYRFAKLVSFIDLATIYLSKKDLDKAEIYALRAANLDPNFPEAHFITGNVYFQKKAFGEAYEEFRKVLDVDPMKSYGLVFSSQVRGLPLYIMLTACAIELGKFSDALVYGEETLKISPNNIDVLNNLGIAYANLRLMDEARRYFEKALAIDPTNTKVKMNMATLLSNTGDIDGALSEMKETLEMMKSMI